MKKNTGTHPPQMRKEELVIENLPDEVLVYDLKSHKAHCLNRTAALIWQHCDGQTPVAEITRRIGLDLAAPISEDLVWLALNQLEKSNLLEKRLSMPPQLAGLSRRELVKRLGLAAVVALPLVTTIIAPTPAQAATCAGSGESCAFISCCGALICNPSQVCQ